MTANVPSFDELVDLLRQRLRDADALEPSRIHSFRELMADHDELIADNWHWEAYEELDALGHLHPASHKAFGKDAYGRLSAEGRWYLRASAEPSAGETS